MDTFNIPREIDSEAEFRLTKARQKRNGLRKLIEKLAEAMEIEQAIMKQTNT